MQPTVTLTIDGRLYQLDTTPADDGSNRVFGLVWQGERLVTSTPTSFDNPFAALSDATLMLRDVEYRYLREEGYL